MAEYTATIAWRRGEAAFIDNRYSRGHTWSFDGGVEIPASSSPQVVPLPMSVAAAVDPEEAFVASVASCHMLWFLSIAAKKGFVVDDYRDAAVGLVAKNEQGKVAVLNVTLHPQVSFVGAKSPTHDQLTALHHESHESCYIASSIRSEVRCEPVDP